MQNGKGDKDRVNLKKYRDNAPEAGIPELPLNNDEELSNGRIENNVEKRK
jgi:hypothetical protein